MPKLGTSVVGAATVAALGIAVWWFPGVPKVLVLPPLLLGVGVGIVARYTDARPGVLVVTATVTTAIVFGFFVARMSSSGVVADSVAHGIAFGALIVVEAALAAGAGALLGRRRRDRDTAAA